MSPSRPFRGIVGLNADDSVPHRVTYTQVEAPDGAPNVLFIVWDDYHGTRPWRSTGGTIKSVTAGLRVVSCPGVCRGSAPSR